ncbi:hypothetical protein [Streptomyces sp. NPDC059759]
MTTSHVQTDTCMRDWGERIVEAERSFPLLEGGRSSARQADVKVE